MSDWLPIVCIPGMLGSPRLYAEQIPALWTQGPVVIAQNTAHDSMGDLAASILASSPPHFALIGSSMGGYICFEILRRAPERVARLALLDTTARPDAPPQTAMRRAQMSLAENGRLGDILNAQFPRLVHPRNRDDARLRELVRRMAEETGPIGFVRQQKAIITRPDSRPTLSSIRCPTLVLVGDDDELTPPDRAAEIANGISGARLVSVPECGHMATLEKPLEVTNALLDLLRA